MPKECFLVISNDYLKKRLAERHGSKSGVLTITGLMLSSKNKKEVLILLNAACAEEMNSRAICDLARSSDKNIRAAAILLLGYCGENSVGRFSNPIS